VPANVPVTPEVVPTVKVTATSEVPTLAIIAAAAVVVAVVSVITPPVVSGVIVPIVVPATATVITIPVNAEGAVVSNKRMLLIKDPAGITMLSEVVGEPTWKVEIAPAALTPENVTCWEAEEAPVLSGGIVPSFVGLLRTKIRIGEVKVDDMFNSLS
jgi:hypothetical protein